MGALGALGANRDTWTPSHQARRQQAERRAHEFSSGGIRGRKLTPQTVEIVCLVRKLDPLGRIEGFFVIATVRTSAC